MTIGNRDPLVLAKVECVGALVYFAIYFTYLFARPESELLHWVSLVFLPLLLLFIARSGKARGIGSVFSSVGLCRGNLSRWIGWGFLAGLLLSALQIFLSWRVDEILEVISSGRAAYLFPLSFVLMFATAGFTEEFFFRGVLLTRLEYLTRSKILGLMFSSLLFGLYHLPYAYANPNWPSAGDWGAAWSVALIQGIPGGLILGAVYLYSGRNLLASAVAHSMINALPAMSMIRFGGSQF